MELRSRPAPVAGDGPAFEKLRPVGLELNEADRVPQSRTPDPPATPAAPTRAGFERKTARADAVERHCEKARGPAAKTPKRDRPVAGIHRTTRRGRRVL